MVGRKPYLHKCGTTTEISSITMPTESDLAGKVLEERMKRKLFFHFLQQAGGMEREYELELR